MNGPSAQNENLPGQTVLSAPRVAPSSLQTGGPPANVSPESRREQEGKDFNRLYAVLSQVNHAIVHARSREDLFEAVCQAALTYGGFRLAWVGWRDQQTHAVIPVACCGAAAEAMAHFRLSSDAGTTGEGPTGTAIREGRTVFCNSVADDPATAHYRALSAEYGIRSAAAFPIRLENGVCAAFVLYAGEINFFGEREVALLEEVAEDVSFALNTLEKEAQRQRTELALREANERLAALFNKARDAMFLADAETGIILDANQEACRLFQRPRESLVGLHQAKLHPPDQEAEVRRLLAAFASCRGFENVEMAALTADGRRLPVEISASFVETPPSGIVVQLIFRDVSEKRAAEASLQRHESLLSSFFRASPVGLGVARDRVLLEVNDRLCEMSGYTREELIGHAGSVLYASQSDFEQVGLDLYPQIDRQPVGTVETRWRRKDGSVYDVLLHSSVLDQANHPAGLTFSATDITQRKKAEENLRHMSRVLEQSPVSVVITDLKGTIEYVNPRFCQLTGYTLEEAVGQNPRILQSGKTPPEDYRDLWRTIKQGRNWRGQFLNRKKNGELYWELASISPLRDPLGKLTHFLAFKEDITERKATQERIQEQAALLNQTQDAILVLGMDRRLLYCNQSAERFYGRAAQELLGQEADALMFPEKPAEILEVCNGTLQNGAWSGEVRLGATLDKPRCVYSRWSLVRNDKGGVTSFLVVNSDITEKKQLEEQFLRAQRMESLGTLASGVAHDLNNVLAPVMMAVDILRENKLSPEDASMLKMLDQGARRGADIIRQLLAFGRGMDGQRADLQTRPLLKEMAKIIEETFPKTIKLEKRFAEDLWSVHVDATQIHQVLLNLCVNARDAMPRGGTLTLAAANVILEPEIAASNPASATGPFLLLEVADTGTGIPPEMLEKIFDPFFTTKAPGKGTGLGLSTVIGIVKNHGGFIKVASRLNEGSRFQIYLPALVNQGTAYLAQQTHPIPDGRGELILVVDDEESVRAIVSRALESHGYRVLVATNGAEGLMTFSQERGAIQAVVADMVMPVMDGGTLIRVLRSYSPGMPVIAMSGLPAQEQELANSGARADTFLHKPFRSQQLLEALHQLLVPAAEQECCVSNAEHGGLARKSG